MRIRGFGGITPKTHETFLETSDAVIARNVDLYRKSLLPFKAPTLIGTVINPLGEALEGVAESVYKVGNVFLGFAKRTSIANDPTNRFGDNTIFFVQNGTLWRTSESRLLQKEPPVKVGISPPCEAPTIGTIPDAGCKSELPRKDCDPWKDKEGCTDYADMPEIRFYVVTYVTACGEESAPSEPSNNVDIKNGDAVSLYDNATPPSNAVKRRWYRSIINSKGTVSLHFVKETDIATQGTVDDRCPNDFDEELKTKDEIPPPECITGVLNYGNNSIVLYGGREIYLSKPMLPHAYQECSHLTVQDTILAGVSLIDTVEGKSTYWTAFFTNVGQYVMVGDDYTSVTIKKHEFRYIVSSLKSITTAEGVIYFATEDGIVCMSLNDQSLITDNTHTEIEWAAYNPYEQTLAYHDGRLFGFFYSSTEDKGFVITANAKDKRRFQSFSTLSVGADVCFSDYRQLYFTNGNRVYLWAGSDSNLTYTWKSARKIHNGVTHFTSMKIVGEWASYSGTDSAAKEAFTKWKIQNQSANNSAERFIEAHPEYARSLTFLSAKKQAADAIIYADKNVFYKKHVVTEKPFRLPRKSKYIEWAVQVTGDVEIYEIHLQTSSDDLTQEGGLT